MYSPKIDEEQVKKLYQLREYLKEKGYKTTMAGLVREMINKGLAYYEGLADFNCPQEERKDWRIKLEERIKVRNRELAKKLY